MTNHSRNQKCTKTTSTDGNSYEDGANVKSHLNDLSKFTANAFIPVAISLLASKYLFTATMEDTLMRPVPNPPMKPMEKYGYGEDNVHVEKIYETGI